MALITALLPYTYIHTYPWDVALFTVLLGRQSFMTANTLHAVFKRSSGALARKELLHIPPPDLGYVVAFSPRVPVRREIKLGLQVCFD